MTLPISPDEPRWCHEYGGIVEQGDDELTDIRPGQFAVNAFMASDNTCPICEAAYQNHRTRKPHCSGKGRSKSSTRMIPGSAIVASRKQLLDR